MSTNLNPPIPPPQAERQTEPPKPDACNAEPAAAQTVRSSAVLGVLVMDIYGPGGAEMSVRITNQNGFPVLQIGDQKYSTCCAQIERLRDWITNLLSVSDKT